ncbi:hypothetical protein D3C72_1317580 [compost metagenome]
MQARLEFNGGFVRPPGRRPTHCGQHACQEASLDVIQGVGLRRAGGVHEALLVARNSLQNTKAQERAADGDEVASFRRSAQGKPESARSKGRVGRQLHQALAEQAQGDLGVCPLEYRACEAEEGVALPVVPRQPTGIVGKVGRPLEKPGTFAFDVQRPSGFPCKPVAQFVGLPPDRLERFVCRRHQRLHQQRAYCLP